MCIELCIGYIQTVSVLPTIMFRKQLGPVNLILIDEMKDLKMGVKVITNTVAKRQHFQQKIMLKESHDLNTVKSQISLDIAFWFLFGELEI